MIVAFMHLKFLLALRCVGLFFVVAVIIVFVIYNVRLRQKKKNKSAQLFNIPIYQTFQPI